MSLFLFSKRVFPGVVVVTHLKPQSFNFQHSFCFTTFDFTFQGPFCSLWLYIQAFDVSLFKMSNNHIIIESDSKSSIPSSLKGGMKFESHSLSSSSGDFKLEIVLLVADSKVEGVSGDSL